METHVSSTTADVPDTQEVIGSHGNVELVIVVEKVDEDQQKADSISQDNAESMMEDNNSVCSLSKKKDGLSTSPSKQDQTLRSVGKEVHISKMTQLPNKTLVTKQSVKSDIQTPQNILPEKQLRIQMQHASLEQLSTLVNVDSTSPKDVPMDVIDEVDNSTSNVNSDREASSERQTDTNCDASEKEHNKSISRELKSLINSAKESKIISECTKLTSKTRKSRAALDSSNTSLSNTSEADSIQSKRRSSSNSQKSNSSEKSDKVGRRSMRSQNPEFVHKVKQFLNSVTGKFQRGGDSDASSASDEEMVGIKNKQNTADCTPSIQKNRNIDLEEVQAKTDEKCNKLRSDPYCWRCHWSIDMTDGEKTPQPPLKCTVCPRAFHHRCLTGTERTKISSEKNWVCPECMTVLHAESSESRSSAMKKTSLGMLCELLKFALQRMTEVNGAEPFLQPVDRAVFPAYDKYVVHPMDLSLMKENISEGLYGSTEAFLADSHWILHNSIIFNSLQSKLTTVARALVRSCRAEMGEIEACPECYAAAHARRPTWFTDVCTTPHVLLWAKLKGFPYWPAKAMSTSHAGLVDVRFFGAHDRAWVPARDCYLYCERDPNNFRTKRQDIMDSMQEAEQHIRNISRKFGKFVYAPFRTVFEPHRLAEQLKLMIPSFDGPVRSPIRERRPKTPAHGKKSRSNSKSSKDDSNVGEILSDSEPMDTETSKTNEETDTKNEAVTPVGKTQHVLTRKRRRSETKEPAGAASDTGPKEKRRLVSSGGKELAPKSEALVVGNNKETKQKPAEVDDVVPDDLIEVDSVPAGSAPPNPAPKKSDAGTARPTPCKQDVTTKTNKNNPKTNDAVLLSNKTPTKSETVKVNDKGKNITQDEKNISQNQRNSRSNKSLTNIEAVEMDDSNTNSPSTNKTNKQVAINSATTYANNNKNNTKDSVSVTKTEAPDSAVLIKIIEKGKKDSLAVNKINVTEKLTEPATITKISDGIKITLNKNKEKEPELTATNKDNPKEKVTTPATTPIKAVGKVVNTAPSTPCNNNLGNEKTNVSPTVSSKNTTNEKTAAVSTPSNNASQEKVKETSGDKTSSVDRTGENNTDGNKDGVDKEKNTPGKTPNLPKPSTSKASKVAKDRTQFDDDTSLAVIARKVPKGSGNSETAMATTSGVRSVTAGPSSASSPTAPATRSASSAKTKTTQITVEANPDSNIFTPTSTDNVRNMKEAVNRLQKLRGDPSPNPQVGRVGVRAFARMASPPDKQAKATDVLVEIKSEPMDYEDSDAQLETSVLDSLRPRPIAASVSCANLREVRISKVMPAPAVAKKGVKLPDVRPRAKKTFPQPKKPDDGRAELTNKNSMVYIPIQQPNSQAPVRAALKAAVHSLGPSTSMTTRSATHFTNAKGLTSLGPQLLPMGPPPPPLPLPPTTTATPTATAPATSAATSSVAAGAAIAGAIIAGPAFPTVPTTVHTVPLITSVNGQWTFSLQPVMSVGAGDSITSPTVNGMGDRAASASALAVAPALVAPPPPPPATAAPATPPALAPPALVPTGTPAPAAPLNRPPDAALAEPPRLQQRPVLQSPLAASTEIGEITAPSAAGPLTAKLNQNSIKLTEFFRTLLEDSLVQVEEPAAEVAALRLQLEQARWHHQHELSELRHTHELLLVEVRSAMEKEKTRAVAEARRLAHQELEAAVKNAKSKQWCSNCGQEAQFYCCWNTSYCDYPCQRAHWAQHFSSCTQQRTTGASSAESRAPDAPAAAPALPASPPEVPKTTSAPTTTGAGKTSVTTRTVSSEQAQNKSPIVVNAVEDGSKQIGTKSGPSASPLHASPLLANKQLIGNEECGKKRVLPSGGYLIVGSGAGAGSAFVAPPEPRRAPPRRD